MVLDSALNFYNSHVRAKIISARKRTGVIRYLSKYASCDVLDQMSRLYVRLHLYYGMYRVSQKERPTFDLM